VRSATRLTFDRASYRDPQWGGSHLYALANRKREGEKRPPYDGKTQVWRLALPPGSPTAGARGQEPFPVTQVEGGVDAYAVAPGTLYYLTSAERIDDEWKQLRQRFREVEYGHGAVKTSILWKL